MANASEGMKTDIKGLSFIDWEGLSDDEYQHLNRIINNPLACSGVKLPFCPDKKQVWGHEQEQSACSQPKQQQHAPSRTVVANSCSTNGDGPVFQTNVPPPPHQPPLPATVPPVVAIPVPVHHWAQAAPPPAAAAGPTHFPMSVQGGYVFPNQPPPPLVPNGDAATIAYVAAMSTGQPVYAIPGVPVQSIHEHYPGSAGYHQVEPMDLSVPVVAQQPVTVHHFVQPDGIVFSPAPHPHHVSVPVAQPSVASAHKSHNLTRIEAERVHNHQSVNHAPPPESHIVHIPPGMDISPSLPQTSPKSVHTSEADKLLVSKKPVTLQPQTNHQVNDKSHTVSSSSSGVEFVGPIVFDSESAVLSKQPVSNGPVISNKEASSRPALNDVAKLNISENAESSSNGPGSSVDATPTQADSVETDKNKNAQPLPPEPSVPSIVSSHLPVEKGSPTDSKSTETKQALVSTSATQATPEPQKPKMWSSLFCKPKTNSPVSPTSPNSEAPLTPSVPNPVLVEEVKSIRYWQEKEQAEAKLNFSPSQKVVPVGIQSDPLAPKILDMLSKLPVVHTPIVIQPRGLVNGSNVCFMNATLQVLMGCPPFVNLFRAFKNLPARQGSGSCTPIFDSLIEFVNSFHNGQRVKSQGSRNKKNAHLDINVGQPFSPTSLLSVAQDILGLRIGIQHDAEEFLSKILMICHEELENIMKLNQSYVSNNNNNEDAAAKNGHVGDSATDNDFDEDDDDSWQKVGPKNHYVETNVNDCGQTPLSSIFSGLSRSCLTRETGKNSDTLDSFFSLKLDIQAENVHSVSDALQRLNVSETLHDIDGGKIQGQRRMFFDILPPVLIMHLKLFQYSDGNGKKIQKQIDFDVDLTIPKETLSRVGKSKYTSPKSRSYKLFGVVNHHGLKMTDGHYTSDVFLPVASGWLRFDDSEVFAIHEKQVLQHSDRHMPYLLFYRRMDIS